MTCWTTVLTCSQEVRNLAYLESNAESKAISCTNLSFTYISSETNTHTPHVDPTQDGQGFSMI